MSAQLPVFSPTRLPAPRSQASQGLDQHVFFVDQYIDFFSTRVQSNSESIQDYLELANLFRQKQKYQKAFILHRSLLARPSINKTQKALIYAEMGYDYLYSKTKDLGQAYFLSALKHKRKYAYALNGLYQSYRQQKKFSQAHDCLKQLLRLDPEKKSELPVLYAEMVMLFLQNNDLTSARRWHKKAMQHGQSAFLDLLQVQLYLAQKKNAQAVATLAEMTMKYGKQAAFLLEKLEDLLFDTGTFDQYFPILHKCHQQDQTHPHINHALAKYYEKTSQPLHAKDHYLRAVESCPSNLQILEDSAAFFHKHNDPDIMQVIQSYLIDVRQKQTFTCQSCQNTFTTIPKNCKTCHGWNLFDSAYLIKD